MSFGSIGSKATQASASSQQLLLPANESQFENQDEQTSSILLQNVIYPSETAFEQNKTSSSESSNDTVVELTDSERNNMGNRQCTSKEQSSKSEEKEDEGDIWVKRDDKSSKLSIGKREEKRKKKKQKNKDKTLNQNNGPGSSKMETTGNGQEHCLSKNHGVVEVKEIDKWAEVKMADDYSSSSTGYHTPEVKTPKLGRTEKFSETKSNNKCEKKSDVMKPELPKRSKMEFGKNENNTQQKLGKNGNITQQSSENTNTHMMPSKQEQLMSQFSSKPASKSSPQQNSKPSLELASKSKPQQISKPPSESASESKPQKNSKPPSEMASKSKPQQNSKPPSELVSKSKPQKNSKPPSELASKSKPQKNSKSLQEPSETISKTEALAKLDSLTNSPRSQRRHALLLSNEVAKYIPLPPEKDRQTTMTIEESPVVYSKIMREPVSSEKIVKCSSADQHQTTPKIQPMIISEFKNTTSTDSVMEPEKVNKKELTEINMRGNENEVTIIEPTSNNNAKKEMRASAIEIMEDNRANELREATTETIESIPGPGVAVLACIPPPEKALISHVPPPSPSSIAIFEEDEEGVFEIDEGENRKSREMEVFNDNVCQRLSLLLETKELMEEKIDDSADSINDVDNDLLSEKSNDSYCSDRSEGNSSDDEYDENDYVQGSDSFDYSDDEIDDNCDFGMDIPAKPQNKLDSKLSIARTPGGKNDASPLDMMNNNFKIEEMKQVSHPPCKTLVEHGDYKTDISKQVIEDTFKPSIEVSEHLEASKHLDDASGYSEQCENGKRHKMSETSKQATGKSDHNGMLSTSPSTKDKHSASVPTSEVNSSNNKSGWGSGRYDSESLYVTSGGLNDRRNLYDEIDTDYSYDSSNSPKRSRLDESIKALFKMPKMEQFPESEYAQNITDLDFDVTPSSDKNTIIEDIIIPEDVIDTQASMRRRSFGYTESSDLDVSEQRDDVSTDSMLADDEDEGEVLFSRTYPEPSGAEVLISCTVVNSAVQSGNNDKFWDDEDLDDDFDLDDDDDDDEEEEDQGPENEHYPQDLFASDAYVDINDSDFDNARKQMQDIHEHLKNLKHQMNNLHDDLGAASCAPEPHADEEEEPVSKRRAMTD